MIQPIISVIQANVPFHLSIGITGWSSLKQRKKHLIKKMYTLYN